MKSTFTILFSLTLFSTFSNANAQGLIKKSLSEHSTDDQIGCGSYDLLKKMDQEASGFLEYSNEMLRRANSKSSHNKGVNKEEVLIVPVVFHVLYNEDEENLHDSVIMNQLKVLNDCFRRRNADTSNMRGYFHGLTGDSYIEFKLAKKDPSGNATDGIVRTKTDVTHFGGILPYGQSETAKIVAWLNDSLFDNYYRMTDSDHGGSKAWDETHYLNIWIGDMRIFEPKVNNFEEVYLMGLASAPYGHDHWKDTLFNYLLDYPQGILMHYQGIGPNNPAKFQNPYHIFNGNANLGKLLAHEAGHYLGLRHIWGDGDCSVDDFIHDTPRAAAASQFGCDTTANTCKDTINGKDLPNMLENYMDYSDGRCQNSFTKEQIAVMRGIIRDFRSPLVSVPQVASEFDVQLYPNPTSGSFTVEIPGEMGEVDYRLLNLVGEVVHKSQLSGRSSDITIEGPAGIYILELKTSQGSVSQRVIKK